MNYKNKYFRLLSELREIGNILGNHIAYYSKDMELFQLKKRIETAMVIIENIFSNIEKENLRKLKDKNK